MRVPPEILSEVVHDVATVAPYGTRMTVASLERAWRVGREHSWGLIQLARARCERLENAGLLARSTGPRGGAGWEWTRLACERYPEFVKPNFAHNRLAKAPAEDSPS